MSVYELIERLRCLADSGHGNDKIEIEGSGPLLTIYYYDTGNIFSHVKICGVNK